MSYTDKYQAGAITNSMLEAAESCPLKFRVLYMERARLESQYSKILDAMSLGILVHEIIERYPVRMSESPIQAVMNQVADWGLTPDQTAFIVQYLTALDMTMADGAAKGKVYVAPTWTGYWKKNFAGLDVKAQQFNTALRRADWLCDIDPMDYILRAITCMKNYQNQLRELGAGYQLLGVEQTFHTQYKTHVLAGTIDRLDYCPMFQGDWITDFKTGSKEYTPAVLHNLNQLHLYALARRAAGRPVAGFRIFSLERNEIVSVPFSEAAHKVFLEQRLPRLIHQVQYLMQLPKDLLPVLAGRSFSVGCPCALAVATGENRCPAIYQEEP